MPRLTTSDVHTDSLLTGFGTLFKNRKFIAREVFPTIKVKNKTNLYQTWGKPEWYSDEAKVVAPGGLAPTVQMSTSTATYSCKTYKMAVPLAREIAANADSALNLSAMAAMLAQEKVDLALERRVAAIVNNAGLWTSATPSPLWGAGSETPILDISTGIAAVINGTGGLHPNVAVINWEAWNKLKIVSEIVSFCAGYSNDSNTLVTPEKFAQAFGFDKVLIGFGQYNTAYEGLSGSYSNIWADDMWIGYVNPNPSLLAPTAGVVFEEFDRTRGWFDEPSETDFVEASQSADEKLVSAPCGYLLDQVIT